MHKTVTTKENVSFPGMGHIIVMVLIHPRLLTRGIRCISTVVRKFFLFQYRSALFPRLPVSNAEHALDEKIPFNPCFVRIYLDFVAVWVRIVGFLGIGFGKPGRKLAADFITSITELYLFAFQIYRKNLSTTARPNYKKGWHFRLIHLLDPHLMCIPSLHIMLMIHSYTAFRHYLVTLNKEKYYNDLVSKVFNGALLITEAVLYIKQHSINCIAAALYTMNRLHPDLFSAADAECFVCSLFKTRKPDEIPPEYAMFYSDPFVAPEDTAKLQEYIICLFRFFRDKESSDWTAPLLEYLETLPLAELSQPG